MLHFRLNSISKLLRLKVGFEDFDSGCVIYNRLRKKICGQKHLHRQ